MDWPKQEPQLCEHCYMPFYEGEEFCKTCKYNPIINSLWKREMTAKKYCDKYDAYYDQENEWLETTCRDSNCEFCAERPKKHPEECECLKKESKNEN